METEILEKEIEENQISFDFLNEKPVCVEQSQSFDWVAQETLVLIVRSNDFISSNFQLCGKSLESWVSLATSGCQQKFIESFEEEDVIETIKSYAENFNFVVVLYSDTPLLKRDTFLEIMNYFSTNRMNVLKLSRGYVFKTEYLQTAKLLISGTFEKFGDDDFLILNDSKKVSYAFNVLNKRILDYHKNNGVVLFGENTIFIDADVEIEPGTIIYPNNILKGETYIGKNVILDSGNHIINTIICENAFIRESYLEHSKVENNKIVGPYDKIINTKI